MRIAARSGIARGDAFRPRRVVLGDRQLLAADKGRYRAWEALKDPAMEDSSRLDHPDWVDSTIGARHDAILSSAPVQVFAVASARCAATAGTRVRS